MEEANLFGQIQVPMKEIFTRIISMEQENTDGLMEEFTKENGLTIKWRVRVFSLGVMDVDTLDNTKTIRNMVMVPLNGQMVENILVTGFKENNMEKVFTLKKVKRDKVFGKWVNA
jgi:hypothetical protein